jgi:hypothetical protein
MMSNPMSKANQLYLKDQLIVSVPSPRSNDCSMLSLDSTRMSIWWWRKALDCPALLHALPFLSAGHQASLQGNQTQDLTSAMQRSGRDSIRFRGESLRNLNGILVDPVRAVIEINILVVAAHHSIEVS